MFLLSGDFAENFESRLVNQGVRHAFARREEFEYAGSVSVSEPSANLAGRQFLAVFAEVGFRIECSIKHGNTAVGGEAEFLE